MRAFSDRASQLAAAEGLAAVEGLGLGVCSRDRERRILYLNPRAEQLLGHSAVALRGQPCDRVLRHADPRVGCLCDGACPATICLETGASPPPLSLSLQTASGRLLAVTAYLTPLRDPDGGITGFVEAFCEARAATADGTTAEGAVVATSDLCVDLARRTVSVGGRHVRLTRTEFDLLACLVSRADRPVAHSELLRQVWGPEYDGQNEYLHTFIAQLRRKIEGDPARPRHIVTERRYGYRFCLAP